MASKYLQKYPVPAGFQQILADFTREVLRDQPPNIIQYASKYFQMLEKGDKFQFNSKYNVGKDDKKYELSYNPKNAEQITKKATSIATKVSDTGKEQKAQKAQAGVNKPSAPAKAQASKPSAPSAPSNKQKNVPPQVLSQLNAIFDQIDGNKNGYIESSEVRKTIAMLVEKYNIPAQQISQEQIKQFIETLDSNNDGKISRNEFINFIVDLLAPIFQSFGVGGSEKTVNQQQVQHFMDEQTQNALQQQMMAKFDEIFKEVDVDRSGFITSNEIQRVAQIFSAQTGDEIDQNELQDFIAAVDTNHDGKISKQELFDFFMGLLASG